MFVTFHNYYYVNLKRTISDMTLIFHNFIVLSICADKPENVTLTVNISNNKVCAVVVVNFTCTAEAANPAPHTYTLFENESAVVQNMAGPGVWIRRLNTASEITYRCEARNSIGNDSSSNTTFTVEGQLHKECSSDNFPNSLLHVLHGSWR